MVVKIKSPAVRYEIPEIESDTQLMCGLALKSIGEKSVTGFDAKNNYIQLILKCHEKYGRSPVFAGDFYGVLSQTFIPLGFVKIDKKTSIFKEPKFSLTEKGKERMKKYLNNLEDLIRM